MKDSISYKNSKQAGFLYLLGNLAAIGFILWAYLSGRYTSIILLFSLFFIYKAYKWIKKLLDSDDQLTFSHSGITIKPHGYFPWEKIQNAEIITTSGKSSTDEIVIELKVPDEKGNSTYSYNCVYLNVKKDKLVDALNHFRKDTPAQQGEDYTDDSSLKSKKNKLGYSVNNSKRNTFYVIIFFVGIIGALAQIQFLRNTIIDVNILVAITLTVGGIASFVDFKGYKATYSLRGFKMFLGLIITQTVSWGLIASSLFISLNYFVVDTSTRNTETFEILEYGSMSGPKRNRSKRKPVVTIAYQNTNKELVFSNKFYTTFEQYSEVELTTAKGLFNYDVIESKAFAGEPLEANDATSHLPDFEINCAINDISTNSALQGSFLILSNHDSKDTLFLEGDTLRFELEFDENYFLEFGRLGYNSKSMDFSTTGIPEKQKELYFVLPMTVSLEETKGEYENKIVADWHFDLEKDTFIWYRD